ncbi:MAG: WYL domain-containing protein [Bacteroidales bacterium]|nr:WYL domain-containing protein [Bacteroidales bacterium]
MIIQLLKQRKKATFVEISDYLHTVSELVGTDLTISPRTFNRDLKDISSLYGLSIKFDFSKLIYFIAEELNPTITHRMSELLSLINTLSVDDPLSHQNIYFENRSSNGAEHLLLLSAAIKKNLQLRFQYQNFYNEESTTHTVESLLIKESQNKWYLFAKKINHNKVECYDLERLSTLEILPETYIPNDTTDLAERLKYCFGIDIPSPALPVEIELSFSPEKGIYLIKHPLHQTQKILLENNMEIHISLSVYLTDDFFMKILSFGNDVKVLKPDFLVEQVKKCYSKSLEQYWR